MKDQLEAQWLGTKLSLMAQLGDLARNETNPETKEIIGGIYHKLRRSEFDLGSHLADEESKRANTEYWGDMK